MRFNFESLTIGEARELEKITGSGLGKVFEQFQSGDYSADLLAAMLLVVGRRYNPNLTLEEIDSIDLGDLELNPQKPTSGSS